MTRHWCVLAVLGVWASWAACAVESHTAPLEHRWIYLATNLLVDKNVDDALALLDRAAKAGYNGVVLTDSKFLRWDQLPERYVQQRPPRPAGLSGPQARLHCLRLPHRLRQRPIEPRPESGRGIAGGGRSFRGQGRSPRPVRRFCPLGQRRLRAVEEQHAHRLELRGSAGQDHLHRHGGQIRRPRLAADAGHRTATTLSTATAGPARRSR